ncbi:MAG TPA: RidA family protein [Caldisericia bacterium]|nr:RidA family protein [Caldisericia bacterium]HPF49257.1 RidA family protein [Caldisericia bacterium]HPI84063.1 RidA family protein [Caldisericia bacterium]HPQ93321.1 RidA family protein [Caldisericia bacterium]HRV75297.1 RidA family protein [Caldisericia bacterium]
MKKVISTKNAPAAIGPYSQAIQAGDFLFVSGQIAIDPETGEQIKTTIAEQTRRALKNMGAILSEAGCSFSDVVKVTVYLTSMDYFKEMGEIYKTFFTENPPARAAVAVKELPLGFDVEMDAIVKLP